MFDSFAAILELKPSSGASMEAVVYAYEFNTPREGGGQGSLFTLQMASMDPWITRI